MKKFFAVALAVVSAVPAVAGRKSGPVHELSGLIVFAAGRQPGFAAAFADLHYCASTDGATSLVVGSPRAAAGGIALVCVEPVRAHDRYEVSATISPETLAAFVTSDGGAIGVLDGTVGYGIGRRPPAGLPSANYTQFLSEHVGPAVISASKRLEGGLK
jgi:hypothetical protein